MRLHLDLFGALLRADRLPFSMVASAAMLDESLPLGAAGSTVSKAIAIPRLAGMHEVQVETATLRLRAEAMRKGVAVGQGTGAEVKLNAPPELAGARPTAGVLTAVELDDLVIVPTNASTTVSLQGGQTATWWQDGSQVKGELGGSGAPAANTRVYAHALALRVAPSGQGRLAVAVAPAFKLGNAAPDALPSLAGATLELRAADGKISATLRFSPALQLTEVVFDLRAIDGASSATAGIATEARHLTWKAAAIRSVWELTPAGVTVTARTPQDNALVAEFPAVLPTSTAEIDYAPAARSLLRKALAGTGSDRGLTIDFALASDGVGGALQLSAPKPRVRDIFRPPEGGDPLELLGAPETIILSLPAPGLVPEALSFQLDGTFGPGMLAAACEQSLPAPWRSGYRLDSSHHVARYVPLASEERTHRLLRLGLFCRAATESELLLSLHTGGPARIGPRRGLPMSVAVAPASVPGWVRVDIPVDTGAGPQPEGIWVLARAPRGGVFWYTRADGTGAMVSPNSGDSFDHQPATPGLQLHVERLDGNGRPFPRQPLVVHWSGGVVSPDAAAGVPDAVYPSLKVGWQGQRGGDGAPLLAALRQAGAKLSFQLSCRRDLSVRLLDPVLTYDPWRATEAP